MWMTGVILSHIFVWDLAGSLSRSHVMLLAVIYLLLTRRQFHWSEPDSEGTMAAVLTHKK